jgi:hypothetical protein
MFMLLNIMCWFASHSKPTAMIQPDTSDERESIRARQAAVGPPRGGSIPGKLVDFKGATIMVMGDSRLASSFPAGAALLFSFCFHAISSR